MTPFPRAVLMRPNSEPRWTECTVMDIDYPEEFFEPWQLWRFSVGSIITLTQLWSCDLRQCFLQQHLVRLVALDHCDWHLCNCLHTSFQLPLFGAEATVSECIHNLQFLNVDRICMAFKLSFRNWLVEDFQRNLIKLSIKPFFWHSLIIHKVWRSGTLLKVFFQGLLPHSCLFCPPILPRGSSVHFFCSSSCSCYFLYFPEHFLPASMLQESPFTQGHSVLTRGNPPYLSPGRGIDLVFFVEMVCFLHLYSLTLTLSVPIYPFYFCFITAFAAVLTFPAAQGVSLSRSVSILCKAIQSRQKHSNISWERSSAIKAFDNFKLSCPLWSWKNFGVFGLVRFWLLAMFWLRWKAHFQKVCWNKVCTNQGCFRAKQRSAINAAAKVERRPLKWACFVIQCMQSISDPELSWGALRLFYDPPFTSPPAPQKKEW